jgi:hypothetical protein
MTHDRGAWPPPWRAKVTVDLATLAFGFGILAVVGCRSVRAGSRVAWRLGATTIRGHAPDTKRGFGVLEPLLRRLSVAARAVPLALAAVTRGAIADVADARVVRESNRLLPAIDTLPERPGSGPERGRFRSTLPRSDVL